MFVLCTCGELHTKSARRMRVSSGTRQATVVKKAKKPYRVSIRSMTTTDGEEQPRGLSQFVRPSAAIYVVEVGDVLSNNHYTPIVVGLTLRGEKSVYTCPSVQHARLLCGVTREEDVAKVVQGGLYADLDTGLAAVFPMRLQSDCCRGIRKQVRTFNYLLQDCLFYFDAFAYPIFYCLTCKGTYVTSMT